MYIPACFLSSLPYVYAPIALCRRGFAISHTISSLHKHCKLHFAPWHQRENRFATVVSCIAVTIVANMEDPVDFVSIGT